MNEPVAPIDESEAARIAKKALVFSNAGLNRGDEITQVTPNGEMQEIKPELIQQVRPLQHPTNLA